MTVGCVLLIYSSLLWMFLTLFCVSVSFLGTPVRGVNETNKTTSPGVNFLLKRKISVNHALLAILRQAFE